MVVLVEQVLDQNNRLAAAKAPHEREVLTGMIDGTDRQIDRLVYELYGLTEDEVRIVDGETRPEPTCTAIPASTAPERRKEISPRL